MTSISYQRIISALFGGLIFLCPAVLSQSIIPTGPSYLADLNVPTYVWGTDSSPPKAIIFGIHGGCLHGTSFNGLGTELARRDYMFVSADMRGYGKWYYENYGTNRDKTFHYKESLADIKSVLTRLRQTHPNTPLYCLGESLGANMAMLVSAQNPELTDGIVAISPFFAPNVFLSPRMLVNLAQVAINPTRKLNLVPYFKTRLANDKQTLANHFNDPLSRDRQSTAEIVKSIGFNFSSKRSAKYLNPLVPILIVAGGKDKLCNQKVTARLFRKLPCIDKELIMLKDSGHLLVETDRVAPVTVNFISNWLDQRSQARIASVGSSTRSAFTIIPETKEIDYYSKAPSGRLLYRPIRHSIRLYN